ncbi:MAG: ABC transporter transmembrane domain-containing protein [Candidatus Gastranaerophilaceae bacterium]
MQKELLKNIFNKIKENSNINLSLIQQNSLKINLERQVGYICKDRHSEYKKYWLTLAFSDAQKYRLKKTVDNITDKSLVWSKYFEFIMPVSYGECDNVYYVLYPFLENTSRGQYGDVKIYEDILYDIYEKESYTVKLTPEKINEIMNSIVEERCPDNTISRENFINSEAFIEYRELLSSYDEIEMVRSHCDFKPQNIINCQNKKYLIGFEFGGIDLPVGFDLFCLRRGTVEKNYSDVPYKELHEIFCKFHHVGDGVSWLKYCNPIVKLDKGRQFIKILENGKFTTIDIKQNFPIYKLDLLIDFQNTEISSAAVFKLVKLIYKKYNNNYIIRFQNCPFWFERLTQDEENVLSFSGVINKDYEEPKNFIDYLKSTQAYVNYSKIMPYVKPYWFRALLAVLICIPIGSLDAVIALSLKPYMDLVMVDKSVQSPMYIPFAIVAFTSVQGFLNYFATYMNTWVGTKITNDLKFDLYKKMLTLETAYFDKKKSGDIVFRFNNDADAACAGLLDNLKTFVSRLFSSLSLVCVLFYNSWQLALIAVFVLGCAFLPLTKIRKRIKDVLDKSISITASIITSYNESFAGNKTIASYNLDKIQETKFKNILNSLFSLKIKLIQRTSWLSPMMHVIVSVGIGIAIAYGSHLILTNQITSGNFVSFITALIMLYTPIKNLGNNFNAVQFSFLAIERVFSILESEPKIKDSENAVVLNNIGTIEFKDVNFEYVRNKPVLKNINLKVTAGETIALVGNSGGGKSTIVSLIPRFYDVVSGGILIDGIDIRNLTLKSLRQNIAIVFQDNFLFSGTIRDNVMLGNENATEKDVEKAIKMAYLDDFIAGLSNGLDTQIGERGILLSGGQKQRVAIARAFLKNAPIVILDEATSALDNKAEAIVQKAIDNLMQDKTVFVIAHRLSTIQNADKIVVINEGEIAETRNHEELLKIDNGAYKMLYEMQFKKQAAEVLAKY